jgi:hypothetical protein
MLAELQVRGGAGRGGGLAAGCPACIAPAQRGLLPAPRGAPSSISRAARPLQHAAARATPSPSALPLLPPVPTPPPQKGRLPIRVELRGLNAADFVRILKEPEYNLIRQQQVGGCAARAPAQAPADGGGCPCAARRAQRISSGRQMLSPACAALGGAKGGGLSITMRARARPRVWESPRHVRPRAPGNLRKRPQERPARCRPQPQPLPFPDAAGRRGR